MWMLISYNLCLNVERGLECKTKDGGALQYNDMGKYSKWSEGQYLLVGYCDLPVTGFSIFCFRQLSSSHIWSVLYLTLISFFPFCI